MLNPKWTALAPIPEYAVTLTPTAAKQRTELNKDIRAIIARRQFVEESAEQLRAGDPMDFNPAVGAFNDSLMNRSETEKDEYVLRGKIDAWYQGPFRESLDQAIKEADVALVDAKAEARQRILDAGFIDAAPTESVPGKIKPGYVTEHPLVIAARNRVHDLRSLLNGDFLRLNRDAMVEIAGRFQKLKDRELVRAGL